MQEGVAGCDGAFWMATRPGWCVDVGVCAHTCVPECVCPSVSLVCAHIFRACTCGNAHGHPHMAHEPMAAMAMGEMAHSRPARGADLHATLDDLGIHPHACETPKMYTLQAADNVRISRTEHAAREKTPGTRRSKGEGWCKPRADAEGAKWTIDEATTVSRLACSAPPPTPLHPQPPRPAPRIFVSIVSYRDPECARTGE